MGNEWKTAPLGDIADVFTGFPFPGDQYSDGEGIRVVRGENVTVGSLRWDTIKGWTGSIEKLEAYSLEAKDIVIGMDGSRVGMNRAQIRETDLPLLLAQRVARIRAKKDVVQDYVAYCIKDESFFRYVESIKTGTSIPHISGKQIAQFQVSYPQNPKRQKAIAHILGTLDDKIELLRSMNETLEAMARALFKSWFIDFDPVRKKAERQPTGLPPEIDALFPDSFADSELGEIPKGWEATKLGDAISINPSRKLTKGTIAKYLEMKNLPQEGMAPAACETKEYAGGAKFQNGDTLFARITPCLENGKTCYVQFLDEGEVAFGSTEYIVLTGDEDGQAEWVYLLARDPAFREYAISHMNGSSGRQRVEQESISRYKVAYPAKVEVFAAFGALVRPYFTTIHSQSSQSRTLEMMRDRLLPRLISGDLELSDDMISKILEPIK